MPDSAVGVRSPITLHGAKSRLARQIIALFPPHQTYVEPFGGSAACLLAKEPSKVEIFNDISGDIANLFRVLRHKSQFQRLRVSGETTLYSRAEFDLARLPSGDPVERARRFLVRQRQSRSGLGERWSYCRSDAVKNMASVVRRWQAGIARLPAIHQRLRPVQIEQLDWREILDRYDSEQTLFYLDPPYVHSARVGGRYSHEMSRADHCQLAARLLRLKGMALLSGYANPIYQSLETAGWATKSVDVPAYSSDRRTRRVECIWISPRALKHPGTRLGTPSERMKLGAYTTHRTRASTTEAKVRIAIGDLLDRDEMVNISTVATIVGMSREHLSRRYNYLFTSDDR